eukprot:3135641-Amphidinium_carterae.1
MFFVTVTVEEIVTELEWVGHIFSCTAISSTILPMIQAWRLMTPQKPLVRTDMYESTKFNTHPCGTNAIVAVITYTGACLDARVQKRCNSFNVTSGFLTAREPQ